MIQVKMGLELRGRVISLYQMVVWGSIPIGFLIASPLTDHLFEPFMYGDSNLAQTIGAIIGTGSGKGMAFEMFLVSFLLTIWRIVNHFYKPLMKLEDILPDAFIEDDKDKIQEKLDRQLDARLTELKQIQS